MIAYKKFSLAAICVSGILTKIKTLELRTSSFRSARPMRYVSDTVTPPLAPRKWGGGTRETAQHLSLASRRSEVWICRTHTKAYGLSSVPAISALGRLRKDPKGSWLARLVLAESSGFVERLWFSE